MNVKERNYLFLKGDIDRDDLWNKRLEYENKLHQFRFWFGLKELPLEPGLIFVRGPRQYGKSTWLELALEDTLRSFGPGSAFYLNGDEIPHHEALVIALEEIAALYPKQQKTRRLFIDEVTAISHWEKAFKIVLDRGVLRDVLVVTTGSKAPDIRRGTERLPGRKGRLGRTDYVFLPISFKSFIVDVGQNEVKNTGIDDLALIYLISGGSPLALNELIQFEKIPEYFMTLVRDWILGEIVGSGRHRNSFLGILKCLYQYAGTPVGYAKLARESGLANNTVAAGYIELLSDLFCVLPSPHWDSNKDIFIQRKPCKFHFTNLAAAVAFCGDEIRTIHDFKSLPQQKKAQFLEWLVAAELFRRNSLRDYFRSEELGFYQSSQHEIDFVDNERNLYEVKLGKASPVEFSWMNRALPNKKLQIISSTPFETETIRSQTLAQWLFECPLDPWPYSGVSEWSPFELSEE